jgi:hypothetical protein
MLLRNLNQSIGLCNGTRVMVTRLSECVMEAKIMTGCNICEHVYIVPKIVLHAPSTKWPSTLQHPTTPSTAWARRAPRRPLPSH